MRSTALALTLLFATAAAQAQQCPADKITLLVVGTYHFDNPGLDAVNLQADDVLSAQRQAELEEVAGKLAAYRPTKITIEAPYRNATWPQRYADYVAGKYTAGRNEIEQLAFRLARRTGLKTVVPVDYPMWMNGWTPNEIELPKEKSNAKWDSDVEKKPASPPPAPKPLSEEDQLLRQSTVLEYLRRLNSPEMIAKNHSGYLTMLLPSKSSGMYEQTDLVTNWYKRNLRIFTNINRVAEPGDRIVLFIGAGHLHILKSLAAEAPYVCAEDAMRYLQ
jgi:hypothetical protein